MAGCTRAVPAASNEPPATKLRRDHRVDAWSFLMIAWRVGSDAACARIKRNARHRILPFCHFSEWTGCLRCERSTRKESSDRGGASGIMKPDEFAGAGQI